jgi:hypothetical protein
LERGQQQFRGEIPSKLLVDTAALIKEMSSVKSRLHDDIEIWRAREAAVLRKIESTVKDVVVEIDKFEIGQNDKISKVKQDLSKLSGDNEVRRQTIVDEISEIRQLLQIEEENRKFADAEILTAVSSYSSVLQRGLRDVIANGPPDAD